MKTTPISLARRLTVAATLACAAQISAALDVGDFTLHGEGSQTYYQSSSNTFLGADNRGTWDNNFLGLVASFSINDRATVWSQLETSSTGDTHFTWFFLTYDLTDNSQLHAGRVKMPLGIYNEITDTVFLQQSSLLPAMYNSSLNWVHDAYNGVGYDYTQHLGAAGKIAWQAYAGDNDDTNTPADGRDRRVFGGRVTYTTPIEGLRLLFSANQSQVQIESTGYVNNPPTSYITDLAIGSLANQNLWIASVDYLHDPWDVKSEYGHQTYLGITSKSYYVQVGRVFATRWTVFGRYEYSTLDQALSSSDSESEKTLAVGLNFKVRSNVSLRIEDQLNHGYAQPVGTGEVAPGTGRNDWSLIIAGVHFIF
jgi:hypothetical protein